MAEDVYFVSHEGASIGPISLQELRSKLQKQDILYTDYLWNPENSAWEMLAQYFAHDFPPPHDPPPGAAKAEKSSKKEALKEFTSESFSQDMGISNEAIWFLFKDNTKFGPYRYLEVVRLLQNNTCAPDDFLWKPGFTDWQRLRACPEFAEPVLKKLVHFKNVSSEKVFIHRRFPRVPYDSEVILHDDKSVLFGAVRSLSEGGAFLEVSKITYARGDRLKLHFTPGGVKVPFNCIAEVTQVTKGEQKGYNVKFIYLEEDDRKRIAQYAESVASRPANS